MLEQPNKAAAMDDVTMLSDAEFRRGSEGPKTIAATSPERRPTRTGGPHAAADTPRSGRTADVSFMHQPTAIEPREDSRAVSEARGRFATLNRR